MKFLRLVLLLLVVFLLLLSACNSSGNNNLQPASSANPNESPSLVASTIKINDEINSKKVAYEFIKTIYTVDTDQIIEYRKLLDSQGRLAPVGSPKYIARVQFLDRKILSLLTQSAYEGVVARRLNFQNVNCCSKYKCTMQVHDLTFTNQFYDEELQQVGYYFDVKLKFSFNKNTKVYNALGKGEIYLKNQDGKWIIYGYQPKTDSYKLNNSQILDLYL